jgi:hypothetical protein
MGVWIWFRLFDPDSYGNFLAILFDIAGPLV